MSYIHKEALLTNLKSTKKYWGSTLTAQGIGIAIEEVERMPEADIAEASTTETSTMPTTAKGHWEETENVTNKNGREVRSIVYSCSECHTSNGKKKSNYCSSCGADMREGE